MDFWEAFDQVEPIGDHWEQTAILAEGMSRLETVIMASVGQEHDPKPYTDYMPARWKPPPKPKGAKRGLGLKAMRAKQEKLINAKNQ